MNAKDCRVEVARCKRNLAAGGSPAFWVKRLEASARELESCAAILREQIESIKRGSK